MCRYAYERERERHLCVRTNASLCQEEVRLSFIPFRRSTSRVQFVTVVSLFAYLAVTRRGYGSLFRVEFYTEFDHRHRPHLCG